MATAPQVDYANANFITAGEAEAYVQYQQSANNFVYQVKGRPAFAFGDIYLQQGQRIIADSSALLWMDGDLEVETGMRGGLCASYMRQCSGEPCCLNTYVGNGPNQKVTVGFELPGDLMAFAVTPENGWVFTYDGFVAGTDNLIISSRISGCCACCCADESVFLTTCRVKDGEYGVVLAGGYGMIERHDIPEGSTLLLSRGLFFGAKDDTSFEVGLIGQECGGLKNLCCTGSGIVFKFHGPCAVYSQSKNPCQLYRDFGIPGGKKTNVKYAKALKVAGSVLKAAGEAQQ